MKRLLPLFVLVTLLGCAETRWEQQQPTQSDPPFGGGFASSNRPGGGDDPMDQNLRRTEFRPVWRGDNGAPETRVNVNNNTGGMSGPDARIDRRTQ
jgi:hypothetical protein